MLNAYHFVYRQYGFEFSPSHQDLIFYEWLGATNRLTRFLKWKTSNMLARAVNSLDLVPCPFDLSTIPPLFDYYFRPEHLGLLRTDQGFHRMKLRRRNRKRYASLIFSVYQAKSASLPAENWEIEQNVEDTIARLATPKELEGRLMTPGKYLKPEDVFTEIDRTLDELIVQRANHCRTRSERVPSRGACVDGSRVEGGSLGWYVRNIVGYRWLPYDYLFGFYEGPSGRREVRCRIEPDVLDDAWRACQVAARMTETVDCVPIGLPEPFKVRVITKGYCPSYSLARAWQPVLWRSIKDHPTFQLIGTPLEPVHIQRLLRMVDPGEENWMISGDYKQATDHIPSEVGNYILSGMLRRLNVPIEDHPALLSALTRHRMLSPRQSRLRGTSVYVEQRSGQLMGSPISFPVLCVYNAVLTRMAYECATDEPGVYALEDIPMLVNGDDLLLVSNLWTYQTWKRVVKWGGLLPSEGKTLVSRNFGTINSTMFQVTQQTAARTRYLEAHHLPHVQLQLAVGSMKSGHYEFESGRVLAASSPLSESEMWAKFMESCRDKVRGWKFLWGANADYLLSLTREFPASALCLPPAAGGLGFPLPPPSSVYYSSRVPRTRSLLLARMLLEGGVRSHEDLRKAFFASLEAETEHSSESVLFSDLSRLRSEVGCVFEAIPVEQVTVQVPPARLLYDVALSSTRDPISDARAQRRSLYKLLLRELRAYTRSGRGPWDLSAVSDFSRSTRWSYINGRYCSPMPLLRESGAVGVARAAGVMPSEWQR